MVPIAVVIEWHTSEAEWVGNTKPAKHASVHVATGVPASEIYGHHDMQSAGRRYVTIADHILVPQAEELAKSMVGLLVDAGLSAELDGFYDE